MPQLIAVDPQNDKIRGRFFQSAFGDETGFMACASKAVDGTFINVFFDYPTELNQALEWINDNLDKNLYYCPHLFTERNRTKPYVKACGSLWADLDEVNPVGLDPAPSIIVQSSTGRWQGLWLLADPADPTTAEGVNRRLTYEIGADKGCWNLGRLLRIPLTHNFKYEGTGEIVKLQKLSSRTYPLEHFQAIPEPTATEATHDIPFPDVIPEAEQVIAAYRGKLPDSFLNMYISEPEPHTRSTLLWALETMCFEVGMDAAAVYSIASTSAVNKYAQDGRDKLDLWKEVCKAQEYVTLKFQGKGTIEFEQLLTDEEAIHVKSLPDTFIERYVRWATNKTDAPSQYHEAGAFIILSTLFAETVELSLSFGRVYPNIWFLILGNSTMTRKTTCMEMALEFIDIIYEEARLATDGSVEGIMQALSLRPNKSSLFARDEVAGLFEAMKTRDYLSGLSESFSRWYEGKTDIRMLKREKIAVRNPRFIFFGGGIKSRTFELLDRSYVVNGFLPRFLFVLADADITAYRPPSLLKDEHVSGPLLRELSFLREIYGDASTVMVAGEKIETPKVWPVKITQEALDRYADFERALYFAAQTSDEPDMFSPTLDRLAKSGLKLAILIACSEQDPRTEKQVNMTLDHMLRAISYIDRWKHYTKEVIDNVGKGASEHRIERALNLIARGKDKRSDLMRSMHLSKREADWILDTLEERGQIVRTRSGKVEKLYPSTV